MTRTRIIAATAAVWSIILIAVGLAFRDSRPNMPQPATEIDFDERWLSVKKSDRLPLPAPTPFAVAAAESEVGPTVSSPPEQLPLATEDDLKQAEAEHHHGSGVCRHGRTYFTIQHHQYWRCKA
jgi:hypothetical protein